MLELTDGLSRTDDVRAMFEEYMDLLVHLDPMFESYLAIQNYEDELRDLTKKYGPPRGGLWLALWNGECAGTIALHPLDATRCELKRLYVRPAYRRRGIGDALTDTAIDTARRLGYRHMLLDTLTPLTTAIAMYRARGFYDIPKYNDSPMEKTYFMQLDL